MASTSAQGKTVVVTGAGGGLGKAIAAAFLTAGANVAICDVNKERLEQTQAEWAGAYPAADDRALVSETDITSEAAVQKFFDAVVAKFGRVDMLVNNAGVMDAFDGVGSTTSEAWHRVIGINLTGCFHCTRAAVNAMLAQTTPGGVVINIGSVASYRGMNAGAAYTASKHAMLGLTKNTAAFYGDKGIFSIALLLGGMDDTRITDAFTRAPLNHEGIMKLQSVNPGYVPGTTNVPLADIAKYCLFFSEPSLAAASNGAAITVNKNWPAA